MKWLKPMTMRVGSGRSTFNPLNRLAKMGTTYFSRAPTIRSARLTIETG